jgi:hypothetical protein
MLKIDICKDPENCDKEHMEENSNGEIHHYGCDCSECLEQYWLLKH